MRSARTTLKDVAREAGVHYSTVSLALAGDSRITAATIERVRAVARRLNYRPNRAARALRRSRTNTLAFVVWGNSLHMLPIHFHEYTLAAAQSALEADYHLLLVCANPERVKDRSVADLISAMDVDGALFVGDPFDRPGLARLVRDGFPVVHLGLRNLPDDVLPYVGADYRQGGRLATEHLLGLGHQRIAALHITQRHAPEIATERVGGYADVMDAAKLPTRVRECVRTVADLAAALEWLRREMVTAVFCAEYSLAPLLVEQCRVTGWEVPKDLSVVAFDDLSDARTSVPPLTTIRQPRDEAGRLAVKLVRNLIDGSVPTDRAARQILLPTELIVRQSTAPPRESALGGK